MAAINVPVKGLTGLITIFAYADDAVTTIADVLASIVASDGIAVGNYYNLALVRDTSNDNLTTPTATLASLNFVGATGTDPFAAGAIVSETFNNGTQTTIPATDIFLTTPASTSNAPASTLQFRQELRVSEVATLNREGGASGNVSLPAYNALNTANLDLLPAKYVGNVATPTATVPLATSRPWTENGLVTYFNPEIATSGTTIPDQSSESQNGTLVNGTVHDLAAGIFILDGVNDYIRSADLFALIGNPDTFSASIWVKSSTSGVVLQVANTTAPSLDYYFSAIEFVESAGNPVPYFGLWNGTSITNDTGSALSYDTWYQMVLTYDGTTCKGYINGSEVASVAVNYDSPYNYGETDQYLLVGAGSLTNMGDGGYLDADLGEIKIYSDVLSAGEVSNNFNITKTRYGY